MPFRETDGTGAAELAGQLASSTNTKAAMRMGPFGRVAADVGNQLERLDGVIRPRR